MKLKEVLNKYNSGDVVRLTYETTTIDLSSANMAIDYITETSNFVVHKVGRKYYLINVAESCTKEDVLAYLKRCEDFDVVYFGECKTIKSVLKEILKDNVTAVELSAFEADAIEKENFLFSLTDADVATLRM